MTRPLILPGSLHDTGPKWVFVNISDQLQQKSVLTHQNRIVAPSEQLPVISVSGIKSLRVNPIDMAHAP
jgi:hypothetical protein